MKHKFVQRVQVDAPVDLLFSWHQNSAAFGRLEPPFQKVDVIEKDGGIEDGDKVSLAIPFGPLKISWKLAHKHFRPFQQFVDYQISGPFKFWEHKHQFSSAGADKSILEDSIEYELPFGVFSDLLAGKFVKNELERLFRYRHQITQYDVNLLNQGKGQKPMRVLVTGASGLIGSSLVNFLSGQGHEVMQLTRHEDSNPAHIFWDPAGGKLDSSKLEGLDAVVHLAGESVGQVWTKEIKHRILESRQKGTRLLAETLARLENPPKVLVSASAVGYYGDRGTSELTEDAANGAGFLAGVCKEWESAVEPAIKKGIRTVNMRFGVVLSPRGGALKQMLPPFQMGAGGNLGHGRQYFSWISHFDAVQAICFAIENESLSGPVNATAPNPVTNAEFTRALGKVLGRMTIFPVPAIAARTIFGEMAEEMLLTGQKVLPKKLQSAGFKFRYPDIESALRHELGK